MSFLSAQEIADTVVRLKLKVMPLTKKGVIDFIKREGWMDLPTNLCRKRTGRGGGFEYHISLLPEALQAALHGEHTRELVAASQQAKKSQELARREKLSTAAISARQREVMNARSVILSAIDMHRISNGMSQRQAIQSFLADPAEVGVSDAVLMTANDRNDSADISMRTIQRWFSLRDTSGLGALAPLPTKEKQDVPSWFWQFLRFY
ncbi:hypothetical protein HNO93_003438, partial [Agrobacterium vitis]|nr:hypothetical protein [Agrobacterium vitis]